MARAKKRADGNYCVTLVIGRDENGKSKRKFLQPNKPGRCHGEAGRMGAEP